MFQGYDVGDLSDEVDGEALIDALKMQQEQRVIFGGEKGVEEIGVGPAAATGAAIAAKEVTPEDLKAGLTYPETWGPSEWGPIPFLPDNDVLVQKLEKQWGDVKRYRWWSLSYVNGMTTALNLEACPLRPLGIS